MVLNEVGLNDYHLKSKPVKEINSILRNCPYVTYRVNFVLGVYHIDLQKKGAHFDTTRLHQHILVVGIERVQSKVTTLHVLN